MSLSRNDNPKTQDTVSSFIEDPAKLASYRSAEVSAINIYILLCNSRFINNTTEKTVKKKKINK